LNETLELCTTGEADDSGEETDSAEEQEGIILIRAADSDEHTSEEVVAFEEADDSRAAELGRNVSSVARQAEEDKAAEEAQEREREQERKFRQQLNRDARDVVSRSMHKGVKLVVHRPEYTEEMAAEYKALSHAIMPIVREIARKTIPLLEHELSSEFARNQYYGSKFQADSVVYRDYRHFAKKRPPTESPSLAVGIRVDESASMSAAGRLEAAKRAVIAVYEFCRLCRIPILIYGDTADASRLEQMAIYAYIDSDRADADDRYKLMGMRARSNNRDGLALRVMAERLVQSPQQTKLLISISDGQPKAMEDYTGSVAVTDMQQTIAEYERKGIVFLAAAIGQDKDVIGQIYGDGKYLDITDLAALPAKLVRVIARYI